MNDLISRQAAIEAIATWDKFGVNELGRVVRWYEGLEPYVHLRDVVWAIEKLPSAHPELIRCGECKHRGETEDGEYNPEDIVCAYWMSDGLIETDYCSYAERREEDG